jgi:hypothetical protein
VEIPEPQLGLRAWRRRWNLPNWPGVYAFYIDGRLIYIGSALNLRKRIAAHVNSRRWVAGIAVKIAVTPRGWRERERRLIDRLRPSDNREWNPANCPKGMVRGNGDWASWTRFGAQ